MNGEERKLFDNVHGIDGGMEKVKNELVQRKLTHKDYLQNLELPKQSGRVREILERKFKFLRNKKSKAKSILEKYKKLLDLEI